jgi:hypothetical protein
MAFRTGHIADHEAVAARRAGLHLHPLFGAMMAAASVLPMATTNRAKLSVAEGGPGILNQHDTGSCEGHAHASGATLLLAVQGHSRGLISPCPLYLGALRFDQTLQPDGTLTTATDTGTMPSSILQAWATFGAQLAKDDPQYPASSQTLLSVPSDPNSPVILPPPERLYAASPYRYKGAYFVTAQGPQRLLQALTALASGKPISDAIPASGQDFQGYAGGILGALSGPIDHANVIVDYEWTGSSADWSTFIVALQQGNTTQAAHMASALLFVCVNSWGEGWGEGDGVSTVAGGTYRANVSYFTQAVDLCVLDLSEAA